MGILRVIGIVLGLGAVCLTGYSLMSTLWAENIVSPGMGAPSMERKAIGLWKYCQGSRGSASVRILTIYKKCLLDIL